MVNRVNWSTRYMPSVHFKRAELDNRYHRNAMDAVFWRSPSVYTQQTTYTYDCGIPESTMIGAGVGYGINFLANIGKAIWPNLFK